MRKLRVLVADDDEDTVLSLQLLLRKENYETRGVFRGNEVLNAIWDFAPDVVLLDIGMPHMTGYEVARNLRERYGSARPVLIALTGHAGNANKRLAHLAGIDHHVSKPYEPAVLLALLSRFVPRAPELHFSRDPQEPRRGFAQD